MSLIIQPFVTVVAGVISEPTIGTVSAPPWCTGEIRCGGVGLEGRKSLGTLIKLLAE